MAEASTAIVIALIASVFPTIGIVATAYFQYKSGKKADVKLDQIHTNVNSNWEKAQKELKELRKTVLRMTKEKAVADAE